MVVGILAVIAQAEARMISERTKAALAARRRRGHKQGFGMASRAHEQPVAMAKAHAALRRRADDHAATVTPIIAELQEKAAVASLRDLATALDLRGIMTPSGRGKWHPAMVTRIMERAAA